MPFVVDVEMHGRAFHPRIAIDDMPDGYVSDGVETHGRASLRAMAGMVMDIYVASALCRQAQHVGRNVWQPF
jgi:hypothetical protein